MSAFDLCAAGSHLIPALIWVTIATTAAAHPGVALAITLPLAAESAPR